jgi:hypothetical protein
VPGMATAPCKASKSNRTPQAWARRSPSQSSGARGSGLNTSGCVSNYSTGIRGA